MTGRQIIILLAGVLIITSVASLLFTNKDGENITSTGGSGRLPVGSLTIHGYDTPTSDYSSIPVGRFFTSDQQSTIQSSLQDILFKEHPKREYRGDIINDSVVINYSTSDVTFNIKVKDTSLIYKVTYNTMSDKLDIIKLDERAINTPGE